jgi:hypothetical protein
MSFFGRTGLFQYSSKLVTAPATIQSSFAETIGKIEGTSTTYGQDITILPTVESDSSTIDAASRDGVSVPISPTSVLTTQNREGSLSSPAITDPEAAVRNFFGAYVSPLKVPVDTVVQIVQQSSDTPTTDSGIFGGFNDRANIAVAAASTGDTDAVVSVSRGIFGAFGSGERSIDDTFLGNFINTSPNFPHTAIVRGSIYKDNEEVKKALTEAQKVDLSITIKSKDSESIQMNTLKEPVLKSRVVYNYFIPTEGDVIEQEDQAKDPLLKNRPVDVPRYVELRWNMAQVTNPLAGTEKEVKKNADIRREYFGPRRGVAGLNSFNFKDSIASQRKRFSPINEDGVLKNIVDIHNPETAFRNTANSGLFANSVSMFLNTQQSRGTLSSIPFLSIRKNT